MDEAPAEKLVTAYLRLREEIRAREEQHKEEMAALEEQFQVVAGSLLDVCNSIGADTIRTSAGTVSRRVQERFWSTDWPALHKFIKEHDALYLLEQRVHNGNMRQFLEENPDLVPQGLQADRKYVVQVRKPTGK